MTRNKFKHILDNYLAGTCSEEEKETVEKWYELLDQDTPLPKTETEWKAIEEKLWNKINGIATTQLVFIKLKSISRYGIAASILLVLGISTWLFTQKRHLFTSQPISATKMNVVENTSTTIKIIPLEDGSIVNLYPKAKISYPVVFAEDKREIKLSGDAFFDIKKNPECPFFVTAGNTVTKVLGTSFLVKATKNNKIVVEVKTGKVTVYEKVNTEKQDNGVILTPNQKVTFYDNEEHFITGIVEKPQVIEVKKEIYDFNFTNTTLKEAVKLLKNAYGIEIVIESEKLGNCTLYGNLNNLDYFTQLEMICRSLNANFQIKGTNILISGQGCN